MIMDNKNYYDLLNVRPNASCREIHASYIRLLEEYKTDLNKTEEEDYFLKMAAKMNIAELEKAFYPMRKKGKPTMTKYTST